MQGLTADEAFQQHQATSGVGAMGGLPVNRMGFNFDEFDRLVSEGVSEAEQNSWDLVEDPETGELVERGEQSDGRWWPPLGVENWVPAYEEDGLLRGIAGGEDWALDQLAEGRRRQGGVGAIEDLTVDEIDRLRDRAEAELGRRRNEGVGRTLPPEEISAEAAGLTADEAFQQHQATAGVGAMAGAGAMGGMNAARRINPNQGELPGTGGPAEEIRRQIEEARKKIPSRTPAEEAAWEKALREGGQRVPAPVVPPPVPPPVSPMEDRNPELRSMDSQMLADMMAQQATQPEQGWLGGALGGVGGFLGGTLSQMQGNTPLPYAQQAQGQLGAFQNMPTEQKLEIVLLGLAAAAAASGVGGPLVPPLLGGSALLTATG
jgi:hypothetical protein